MAGRPGWDFGAEPARRSRLPGKPLINHRLVGVCDLTQHRFAPIILLDKDPRRRYNPLLTMRFAYASFRWYRFTGF